MFVRGNVRKMAVELSKRGVGTKSKARELRDMLESRDLEFIMEAHNGLSARVVEEAGFKGIWGSGLSISAACGVRDANEMSWTQVTDVLATMRHSAPTMPILLDGDTGYGNFNNARLLVNKLEQLDVGGVCIEDKLFPKTNSLLDGVAQPLADPKEFALKIQAMKDSQKSKDFVVAARCEAFIAGWGLDEMLRRAHLYVDAGADAVLVHSKLKDCSEIEAFMKAWNNKAPVIIVPTKYYKTPTDEFRKMGISMVIWANHNMRASLAAMQNISKMIKTEESLVNVEKAVASVEEVFRITGDHELRQAENKYLPK